MAEWGWQSLHGRDRCRDGELFTCHSFNNGDCASSMTAVCLGSQVANAVFSYKLLYIVDFKLVEMANRIQRQLLITPTSAKKLHGSAVQSYKQCSVTAYFSSKLLLLQEITACQLTCSLCYLYFSCTSSFGGVFPDIADFCCIHKN